MSDATRRPPAGLDTSVANVARMNDYYLGGKDNFAADRKAAEEVLALAPEVRTMAREGQAFMIRAVRYLLDEGVTQFVSLGVGLPTRSSIHYVAQELVPDARVVYVSTDPVVLSHARALLATNPATAVVEGDILHPRELLADPGLRGLVDLDRPVAILIASALQFIPDEDDPFKCVAVLRDALPVGSCFALGHVVFERRPEVEDPIVGIYRRILGRDEGAGRSSQQVLRFFDGMELVEPGFVYTRDWRPDNPLTVQGRDKTWSMVGIARKTEG
ncbi:S-adenosyl methyltransferase [Streptosporangium subroseum]|uniref:S-adenosyl methyltransferase n=1 Tax=Streptosporangium subroseum TaxID=106412 RepID=A0A239LJ17_9ACTN|nr:SAM-dependent methyltransferase [Streptosporangium subroseum]SNT29554.1 S-adenosyl methyltransferase [Streptosporangium subroseum]